MGLDCSVCGKPGIRTPLQEKSLPLPPDSVQHLLSIEQAKDVLKTSVWKKLIRDDMPVKLPPTSCDLVHHSIFKNITIAPNIRIALQSIIRRDAGADRAVGALVGLALGDAVGHPMEFVPVTDLKRKTTPYLEFDNATGLLKYHDEFNRFKLKSGQWTDDTSMSLCVADSLLVYPDYNGGDCRARFHSWWFHGYNNAFRFESAPQSSVGLGGNISKSLEDLKQYANQPVANISPIFTKDGEDAGNGSIMRLAPIPVRYHYDLTKAYEISTLHSLSTHPGDAAAACCNFVTCFIARAIHRSSQAVPTIQQFVDETIDFFLKSLEERNQKNKGLASLQELLTCTPQGPTEQCWNWKLESLPLAETLQARGLQYNGYPVDSGYFGAYCMDGLAMALWGLYHTTSFADCIRIVVNLLGDADTTGAIAGQMAGAFYGYHAMQTGKFSSRMVSNLERWDPHRDIPLRAVLLYYMEYMRS
jgi:ADP-ribosylglycohydrolase